MLHTQCQHLHALFSPLMIQAVRNNSCAIIKLVLRVGGNRVRLLAMPLNGAINKVKSPFKVKTADTVYRLTVSFTYCVVPGLS